MDSHTAATEIEDCILSKNDTDKPVNIVKSVCTKWKSRYKSLYCFYHVEVCADCVGRKRAIDLFMYADAWPAGILVRRYFKPKKSRLIKEVENLRTKSQLTPSIVAQSMKLWKCVFYLIFV